jgi:hypothetical protein
MNVNEVEFILSLACAERSRSEGCDWGEDMKKRIAIIGGGHHQLFYWPHF